MPATFRQIDPLFSSLFLDIRAYRFTIHFEKKTVVIVTLNVRCHEDSNGNARSVAGAQHYISVWNTMETSRIIDQC